MTEDALSLVDDLDALEDTGKGPGNQTCIWWRKQTPETLDAVKRAVGRVGHTGVTRLIRAKDRTARVTPPNMKLHAEGKCDSCR